MENFYNSEINVQMLVSLLKAHNIKKIIVSPGTTNLTFVGSVQNDSFFEIYSCVDERSAAYMACGMAAESGEPVVLSCTGATAARNYVPALTEAFYRKLPILAITSTQNIARVGLHVPQVTDRSHPINDLIKKSLLLPKILTNDDVRWYSVKINDALLELWRHGCGPVHINLMTDYSGNFSVKELPKLRAIQRVTVSSQYPPHP